MHLEKTLEGGDLRSIGNSNILVSTIKTKQQFDKLFAYLFHANRVVVMRAADCVEKITADHPEYLSKHKRELLNLCEVAKDKELKWHLAQLIPRLNLNRRETADCWRMLTQWTQDKNNSRIVRVNSIQALHDLLILLYCRFLF